MGIVGADGGAGPGAQKARGASRPPWDPPPPLPPPACQAAPAGCPDTIKGTMFFFGASRRTERCFTRKCLQL